MTSNNARMELLPFDSRETGKNWHFANEWLFKRAGSNGISDVDLEVLV